MDRLWMTIFGVLAASLVSGCLATVPYSFQCPGVGTFPDPTDCHNFYNCDSSLVPNLGTCMDGTGTYDSNSQVCRVTSCSGPPEQLSTSAPAFTCTTVGVFADPTNCHNYYTCGETLQPIPGSCMKGNGTFDPVNEVCTTEPCPDAVAFVCSSSGFFADPKDCHGFYVCDEDLDFTQGTCTAIARFDPQLICVVGSCSQSLNTTTTTTTTTAAAPVTPSNIAFKCTAEGYFADPKDCHSYYACDSSLKAVRGTCMGGGGHFDPESEGCLVGSC
ncbi:hypothetical protein L798_06262 [Zootermopsis nevadensis]|uniref:Chitin-binding type-2 domain-containing protein n=1 Tax=Zootermopsis nevadensis TaxID=136037 RepID=A0A067R9D7_ZOONE|nr:hypothetical protein L798_06262 [Zootermopsis nevadensis]